MNRWKVKGKAYFFGTEEQWFKRLTPIERWEANREKILTEQQDLKRGYFICFSFFLLFVGIAIYTMVTEGEEIFKVGRPDYKEGMKTVEREAIITYQNEKIKKRIELPIAPKKLSEKEARMRFQKAIKKLPKQMKGKNKSLSEVNSKLSLPDHEEDSGIKISWESSDESRIQLDGSVDPIGVEEGSPVILTANLSIDTFTYRVSYPCVLVDNKEYSKSQKKELLENRFSRKMEEEKEFKQKNDFVLPQNLGDGISVRWQVAGSRSALLSAVFFFFLFLMIGLFKFKKIEKEKEGFKKRILSQLPDCMDEIILMLNAGLILSSALKEMFLEEEKEKKEKPDLKNSMQRVYVKSCLTNQPFSKLFLGFSIETELRQLIRFATLLDEHRDKGVTLAEKLEAERDYLLQSAEKQKESALREVEVKLIGPLIILLTVLILLSVGPVLLEF